jgi:prepilin-type processing-associated H-X9-DG protein
VELLVVIGIIALLISILLPALNKARKASRTTACLSNVRQLAMAEIQYVYENRGHFSPYYDQGGTPTNPPFQINWMAQINKPEQMNKVRLCPEASEPNPQYNTNGNWAGAAFYQWGPSGRAMQYFVYDPGTNTYVSHQLAGSYGYNGYLLRDDASGSGDNNGLYAGGSHKQAARKERLHVPPVKSPTEVPIVADSTWPIGWPKELDPPPASLYQPDGGGAGPNINGGPAYNWNIFCIARHGMAVNVAFMDGHASTVQLPDLWLLHWHAEWNVQAPRDDTGAVQPAVNLTNIRNTIKSEYKG